MKQQNSLQAVRLIIFDFDGVLVDTQGIVNEVEWHLCIAYGADITRENFAERFSGERIKTIIETLQLEGKFPTQEDANLLAHQIENKLFTEITNRSISSMTGVEAVLQRIPFDQKCIGSNCPTRLLNALLDSTGLSTYFNGHVFSADLVERPKPYPDVYLYAATAMGELPEHCLVIDDSEAGVRAGVAAGMRVFGFMGGSHTLENSREKLLKAGAERVVQDMDELLHLFGPDRVHKTLRSDLLHPSSGKFGFRKASSEDK